MKSKVKKIMLLEEGMPKVAEEIRMLLKEERLKEQISHLLIIDRCRCRNRSCATIYTVERPNGSWGAEHTNIVLNPKKGYIILDVVDGYISCIEILDRLDIRKQLMSVCP